MDGGRNHPIIQGDHLEKIGRLMKKGVGIAGLHYAIEVPRDKGGQEFLEWLGGYYGAGYSQNPVNYVAVKQAAPKHPISRGWSSFAGDDEWYFHIRFRPDDPRGGAKCDIPAEELIVPLDPKPPVAKRKK